MLKLRTLFSGIGAPESALKNIGLNYELVNFCELDKFAIKSYCAVHEESVSKNLGDISKVNPKELEYADLMVWGFPCQDISTAGKQKGIVKDETRSGLYHYGYDILKETKPKYSIIENVKNLVGKKFKDDFEEMLKDIENIGYNNYYKVLNAKNYGIPQNRERVFIVSIRKDIDNGQFKFPIEFDNGLRLKDFIDADVDEKFYLDKPWHFSTEVDVKHDTNEIAQLDNVKFKSLRTISDVNKFCRCLDTMSGGQREPKILRNNRPCRLTPRECWRLMGFKDEEFQKAQDIGISNSQLYKQAGNSIVTDVLATIFKNMGMEGKNNEL